MFKMFLCMAVIIFIWVFSLPILIITSVLWVPVGSALILTTASISFYIQWHHADTIIVQSVWRDMISCIPIADWFESYTVSGNVTPPRTLILAHPHGILCCGMTIYHFQHKNTVMAVAPILFYVPIFGWFARAWGLIPATDKMIRKALEENHSVILYPGGVQELIGHENKKLYINKRWGYLKIIKDLQCNVACAWTKGEFDTFFLPPLPLLELRQKLVKWTKIGIMFPWIFGWNSIWMPRRVPLEVNIKMLNSSQQELMGLKRSYHHLLRRTIEGVYGSEQPVTKYLQSQVDVIPLPVQIHQNLDH